MSRGNPHIDRLRTELDLPEALPAGESILWIGRPDWWRLAVEALHLHLVAFYFVALALWRGLTAYAEGGIVECLSSLVTFLPVPAVAIGLLLLLAWLHATFSVYAITNRRLILRIGIALPLTINLPFGQIESAGLMQFRDGHGDIPLRLRESGSLGFAVLWPHVRPWRVRCPEPMLRAVPDAARVARVLANAVSTNQDDVKAAAPARDPSTIATSPLATASR